MFSPPRAPRISGLLFSLALAGCVCHVGRAQEEAAAPPSSLQVSTQGAPGEKPVSLAERAAALPASGKDDLDGLEAQACEVLAAGNPAKLELVALNEKPAQGAKRLALELTGGAKDFTGLRCAGAWRLKTASSGKTVLVIYNDTGGALRMSIAYSMSEDYVWYESPTRTLETGWNTIVAAQGTSDFKTASSGWRHNAALWKPEDCRAVTLVFHSGRRTGRLFVDWLYVSEEKRK